jgi:hypothetical protein
VSLGRQLLVVALVALVVGGIASGVLTAAFVNQNLSGEYADQETGAIDLLKTTVLFLIFIIVFAGPLLIVGACGVVARRLAQRGTGNRPPLGPKS